MPLTASAVVTFGSGSESSEVLAAEVDSRTDGLNGGKSSFEGSDSPVMLIWASIDYSMAVSQGSVTGAVDRVVTDETTDVVQALQPGSNSVEISLGKPASLGSFSFDREYSSATVTATLSKRLADGRYSAVTLSLPDESDTGTQTTRWIVGTIKFKSYAKAVRITPPPSMEDSVAPECSYRADAHRS